MRKIIIKQTNNLVKIAKCIAKRDNINSIPYPGSHFKNNKELENYLNTLTNFLKNPEIYYSNKKSLETEELDKVSELSKSYFKFI
jgi:pantothenate kinase